jgi:hypothetical protein
MKLKVGDVVTLVASPGSRGEVVKLGWLSVMVVWLNRGGSARYTSSELKKIR